MFLAKRRNESPKLESVFNLKLYKSRCGKSLRFLVNLPGILEVATAQLGSQKWDDLLCEHYTPIAVRSIYKLGRTLALDQVKS